MKRNSTRKRATSSSPSLVLLIFAILGIVLFFTPIQHHISIGRAQHHGMAIGLFGLGFLVQTLVAFKEMHKWAIRAYLSAGGLFLSVGVVFYKNPWIYTNVAVQTEENLQFKGFLLAMYLIAMLPLTFIWIKWIIESSRLESENGKKNPDSSKRVDNAREDEEDSN